MFDLAYEPQFKADFRRTMRRYPQLLSEFRDAAEELRVSGVLPGAYGAHELDNPGGNYNGCMEFHLADGKVDVLVLYLPHKMNPVIRFIRMGSHEELFRGPVF